MPNYPGSVYAPPTRNTGDTIPAADFNNPAAEIVAIEQGLLSGFQHLLKPFTSNLYDLGTTLLLFKNEYLSQTLFGTQGAITVNTPFLNLSSTWNAGGVTFQGILLNVTDTASAAASTLIDLQKAGVTQFKVDKIGNVSIANTLSVTSTSTLTGLVTTGAGITTAGPILVGTNPAAAGQIRLPTGFILGWRNAANSADYSISGADAIFTPSVDGAVSLGTATNRWGNVVLSGSVIVGTTPASGGVIRLPQGTSILWRNAANTGDAGINYDGGVILAITSGVGGITFTGAGDATSQLGNATTRWTNLFLSTSLQVISNAAVGNVLATLRGVASQTGDFLDLQNSASNNIFQFTSTASMVNGIQFNPANTGGQPFLQAIGTDAVVSMQIRSQGSSSQIQLANSGAAAAGLAINFPAGTTVDGIAITPSATANPATVSIAFSGTDSNGNLNLISKGTGTVQANGLALQTSPQLPYLQATNANIPATAGATLTRVDGTSETWYILTYPKSGTPEATFEIPSRAFNNVRVTWRTVNTSGACRWLIEVREKGANDVLGGGTVIVTSNNNATANATTLQYTETTIATVYTPGANKRTALLRVMRDSTNAGDTLTVGADILYVELT